MQIMDDEYWSEAPLLPSLSSPSPNAAVVAADDDRSKCHYSTAMNSKWESNAAAPPPPLPPVPRTVDVPNLLGDAAAFEMPPWAALALEDDHHLDCCPALAPYYRARPTNASFCQGVRQRSARRRPRDQFRIFHPFSPPLLFARCEMIYYCGSPLLLLL